MAVHSNSQGETRKTRNKYLVFQCCLSSQTARLRPRVCKIDHIKLSVKLSIAVLETNCTTPNETDNHPIEWREEAAQRPVTYLPFCLLSPLLVFLCVCVCLCVSLWTAGGREMKRPDRRWAIIVWKVLIMLDYQGKKKKKKKEHSFLFSAFLLVVLYSIFPKPGYLFFVFHGNYMKMPWDQW